MTLNVVTMNLFAVPYNNPSDRIRRLCKLFIQPNDDIVCFQEVHLWRYAKVLLAQLPQLPHVAYAKGLFGPKAGLMMLSRRPIHGLSFTSLVGATRGQGGAVLRYVTGGARHKGILMGRVGNTDVVCAHLSPNIRCNWSPGNPWEALQRAQVWEVIRLARPSPRVVVCGDFNVDKGSLLYHELRLATGWHDPLGYVETYPLRKRPPVCIDHVFLGGFGLGEVTSASVLLPPHRIGRRRGTISDHNGIRVCVA